MDNKKELKQAILQNLAEKGDYQAILKHLSDDEDKEKKAQDSDTLTKLIKPMSAVADILTQNATGAFRDILTDQLDEIKNRDLAELTKTIQEAKAELQTEVKSLLAETKDTLATDNLTRYQEAETKLSDALMKLAVEVVADKADELLPGISEDAKLTQDEIDEIIYQAALSVESQMNDIVGAFIADQTFSVSQIQNFKDEVQKLIPQIDLSNISVDYSQVRNAPSVGGTNANLVRQIVNEAIVDIEASVNIAYQATAPTNPEDGDLWVDTTERFGLPVQSFDITSIVALTQAEYDALTPVATTLYVIID